MKLLLTTIAAVVLVGCGTTQSQEKTPKVEPPSISIHKAASIGDIEAVRQHLAAGTDPNLKSPVVNTPLMFAGYEIMTLLVGNGADVNDIGWRMTALHMFTDLESVRYLVDKVADVNAIDKFGDTPLHKMVEGYLWKQKESVEILIAAGADVNALNFDGLTPLDNFLTNLITAPRQAKLKREFENLLRKHGAKTSDELKPFDKEKDEDKDDNKGLDILIKDNYGHAVPVLSPEPVNDIYRFLIFAAFSFQGGIKISFHCLIAFNSHHGHQVMFIHSVV